MTTMMMMKMAMKRVVVILMRRKERRKEGKERTTVKTFWPALMLQVRICGPYTPMYGTVLMR